MARFKFAGTWDTNLEEFSGGADGPVVVYDDGALVAFKPTKQDLALVDRAFRSVSLCVAPGALRPDDLARRPANDQLEFYIRLQQTANDVQSVGLAEVIPTFIIVLYAVLERRIGRGSGPVVLRIGELSDHGYEVLVDGVGRNVRVTVRPLTTGLRPTCELSRMLAQGFPSNEVVQAQLIHASTPEPTLLELQRRAGKN